MIALVVVLLIAAAVAMRHLLLLEREARMNVTDWQATELADAADRVADRLAEDPDMVVEVNYLRGVGDCLRFLLGDIELRGPLSDAYNEYLDEVAPV